MERLKNFLLKNSGTKQTIAKNTIWLFLGDIAGRLLKLTLIIFATRILGANGWGTFSYTLAFVSVFYVFSDIGINTFITRELSRESFNKYQYLSASLLIKVILLLFSFVVSLFLIPHFATIHVGIHIIIALALLNFSDSIREFAFSVNRALQKMEREAFIKILMNFIICVLGIALLLFHATPLSLAIAYATGSIVASIIAIVILTPEIKNIQWHFPFRTIKTILDFAWPFIATTLFMTVIVNIDTIMLGQLKSAAEVGLYAAAERIVQFLAIIPVFISLATFPLMTKAEGDAAASGRMFEKIMAIILVLGIPVVVGGFLFSGTIMSVVFGPSYVAGTLVMAILMFSLLADFPNILIGNVVFAKDLQKKFIFATALGMTANVALNLYLIPRYGAVGAATSTTLSQLFIMTLNWINLKRFVSFSIVPKLGKIALATMVMALIIVGCTMLHLFFVFTIIIASVAYVVMLYSTKEAALQEILLIVKKQ